jgi:polyketide biosynthesis acyl carrier protein
MSFSTIYSMIKETILDVLPELQPQQVEEALSLKDLGANSIDRAEIAIQMMERLELKIPPVELTKVATIGELAELLFRHYELSRAAISAH